MTRTVDEWRKSGDYLPDCMKDFHDQKDLFKALHERVAVEKHGYAKTVDWVTGQCYVVDIFLWWMARHGYTLQRSRAKLPFDDLDAVIAASNDHRTTQMAEALGFTENRKS